MTVLMLEADAVAPLENVGFELFESPLPAFAEYSPSTRDWMSVALILVPVWKSDVYAIPPPSAI